MLDFAIGIVVSTRTMLLDEECFHSSISCRPDSLKPKLVVKSVTAKPSMYRKDPTQYELQCSLAETEIKWSVERRYSEFRDLQKVLQEFFFRRGGGARPQCFGCAWFTQSLRNYGFPRRRLLRSRLPDVIEQRRVALHKFVLILVSHTFSAVPKCVSCASKVFPQVREFFLRDATLPDNLSSQSLERMLQPRNFSPVADPSKSSIEFRKARSVWKVLQMEKPVYSKVSDYQQQIKAQKLRRASRPSMALENRWLVALEESDSNSNNTQTIKT